MVSAYNLLKFVHVLSVIAWVGGVTCLSVVIWRLRRERNREVLAEMIRQATTYMEMVVGPASGIVLLTGATMVGIAKIGFGTLWVVWGFAGILIHGLVGALVIRKRIMVLATAAAESPGNDAALQDAGRRVWTAQLIYLTLMASVVGAMVIKPTL